MKILLPEKENIMTSTLHNDTICAVSTPAGVGGIAVIRVSGPLAQKAVLPFLNGGTMTALVSHRATFVTFDASDRMLDEVVVTLYAAPHSYTGEEVVEVACHGSLYVQQAILQALVNAGLRLAEPGEFTRRAFLNGRLDLSQAEAVADLIDSTNAASHQLAVSQLRGGYSLELSQLRTRFVELMSLLELELDFSDEEVEFADRAHLRQLTDELLSKVTSLCDSFSIGNAIKQGVPVAIVGRPNVGKSTLLNALLHADRAIVSDRPGTTRDTIEDSITIGGIKFRFVDTAGMRHSDDTIEKEGIRRGIRAAEEAQIILYLVEASQDIEEAQREIDSFRQMVNMESKHLLLVFNKVDLCADQKSAADSPSFSIAMHEVSNVENTPSIATLRSASVYAISAKMGQGIEDISRQLVRLVKEQMPQDSTMVSNVRHYEALKHVREALTHVQEGLARQLPADLVVIDLREALHYLGQITGQVSSDEVLGAIFSRFCIGK